jgi:hypothetical protein
VNPTPAIEAEKPVKQSFVRVLGWSIFAVAGGASAYRAFAVVTGMEVSLIGIPVGLAVGLAIYYASRKRGGRWFQTLAVVLAYVAFSLTYAPGMFGIAMKRGFSVPASVFAAFMTLASPLIDSHNGFLSEFMVLAGMYLAWTLARRRTAT